LERRFEEPKGKAGESKGNSDGRIIGRSGEGGGHHENKKGV